MYIWSVNLVVLIVCFSKIELASSLSICSPLMSKVALDFDLVKTIDYHLRFVVNYKIMVYKVFVSLIENFLNFLF